MILCDIGNTSYHFLDGDNDYKKSVKSFDPLRVTQKIYYICVNPKIKETLLPLKNWIDMSQYISTDKYYSTMGVDRIFACEAILDGVIVDAGSAITVDIVSNGIFKGGFIYPGTVAMNETYKNISSALDYPFNYDLDLEVLPKNSIDAISYGYFKTLYLEVVSHKKEIFLTGGDAQKLFKIFPQAKLNEHLLFDGMKQVLKQVV